MSEMPLFQSLSSVAFISLVLVAVLYEPTSTELKEKASPTTSVQVSHNVKQDQLENRATDLTPQAPDYEEMQIQIATLVSRVESLEAKLLQQHTTSPAAPESDGARLQSPQYPDNTPQLDLEALWVGQPNNPDWEVRVENDVIHLAAETMELGLGQTKLSKADCRGDLCQLSISSAIPAAMLQHLLTRYVGNIRTIESDANSGGNYSVFVEQTN